MNRTLRKSTAIRGFAFDFSVIPSIVATVLAARALGDEAPAPSGGQPQCVFSICVAAPVLHRIAVDESEDASGDGEDLIADEPNGEAQRGQIGGGGQAPRPGVAERLADILDRRMRAVELACELSEPQKERLRLAARGDLKHTVERARTSRKPPDRAIDGQPLDIEDLGPDEDDQALELRPGSDPFDGDSLFDKILRSMATAQDLENYSSLMTLERAGAQIVSVDSGPPAATGLRLTDVAQLEHFLPLLGKVKNLRRLSLADRIIADIDLMHLEGLSNLEFLDLSGTAISDRGLEHLRPLVHLKTLRLEGTLVTGAGLQQLKDLRDLEDLSLAGSQVDDAGLAAIAECGSLRVLGLRGTLVSDAGMRQLKRLQNLERLVLDRTDVTDVGMREVRTLKGLQFLSCSQTLVSHSGIAMLYRWRPEVKIVP